MNLSEKERYERRMKVEAYIENNAKFDMDGRLWKASVKYNGEVVCARAVNASIALKHLKDLIRRKDAAGKRASSVKRKQRKRLS